MNSDCLVNFKKLDPESASELIRDTLVEESVANLITLALRKLAFLAEHLDPVLGAQQISILSMPVKVVEALFSIFG